MIATKHTSLDEYIASFPEDKQKVLQEVRKIVKDVVPEAEETISYAMPTFTLNKKYVVYFAAFKNHIGFYPAPVGDEAFKEDLLKYKTGKGSVQFPLDEPMPKDLIIKIVQHQVRKNTERSNNK